MDFTYERKDMLLTKYIGSSYGVLFFFFFSVSLVAGLGGWRGRRLATSA